MIKIFYRVLLVLFTAVFAIVLLRVFFFDQFRIGGNSMEPTLHEGDRILVNKVIMGARIYKRYNFTNPELKCFRMPALRNPVPGDILVFNNPRGWGRKKIVFRINNVFVKRCIGCPGDTVSIIGGYYYNNHIQNDILPDKFQRILHDSPDSVLVSQGTQMQSIPHMKSLGWTIRNMGPLLVPHKGDTIVLNPVSSRIYSLQIEYETGEKPIVSDNQVYLKGGLVSSYRFTSNWYFLGGDNVLNSKDSRYIGLIPEDYITGIATRKLYNRDSRSNKISFSLFMSSIKQI